MDPLKNWVIPCEPAIGLGVAVAGAAAGASSFSGSGVPSHQRFLAATIHPQPAQVGLRQRGNGTSPQGGEQREHLGIAPF